MEQADYRFDEEPFFKAKEFFDVVDPSGHCELVVDLELRRTL